jgi:UTP--glucose-1-phosphate uridylyltransferase
MVEKPKPENAPSNLSITGRYVLNSKIFEYLDRGTKSIGGEIQLTDSMLYMLNDGAPFYGLKFTGRRFDCGNRLGFLEANIAYALERDDMRDRVKVMLNKYSGF